MITRDKKDAIIADLKDKIENARAVFLTNLIGVPSNDANEIRKQVRESKGAVVITRNTLLERAAKGTTAEALFTGLKGPNAAAFAFEDAPGVAKALYEAGKEMEVVTLTKGLLNGKELDSSELQALAKLPTKDVMLATVLATMNAPIGSFVRVLDAIRTQKEESGEAPAAQADAAETATETTEE